MGWHKTVELLGLQIEEVLCSYRIFFHRNYTRVPQERWREVLISFFFFHDAMEGEENNFHFDQKIKLPFNLITQFPQQNIYLRRGERRGTVFVIYRGWWKTALARGNKQN